MRVITYKSNGSLAGGILKGEYLVPLGAFGYPDVLSFLKAGEPSVQAVQEKMLSMPTAKMTKIASVTVTAPIPCPGKILCVGMNYRDHAIESKVELPATPTIFLKLPTAVIGAGMPIILPKLTQKPDWEAELAVVIGKHAKNVPAKDWEQYVFGYTILNDVSARDILETTSQWTLGKSFNTFAPMGPWIVTKDEIPDPHSLRIKLSIDGAVQQDSNTRGLVFKIPELIAYISSIVPLEPGDILSTGTPAGVGLGKNPQRWLKAGEEVVIEIEKIGSLQNPVTAE